MNFPEDEEAKNRIRQERQRASMDQVSEMQDSLSVQTRDALRFYGARSALSGSGRSNRSGRSGGKFLNLVNM